MISLVTNASLADADRIRTVVPHWLKVFGPRAAELVVVLDTVPAAGRLRAGVTDGAEVRRALRDVSALDSRVRVVDLPPVGSLSGVSAKWFFRGHPVRCQAGTPILAFLYAIEQARTDVVLRADCDILFCESGWLDEAARTVRSGEVDLVEPPRLGGPVNGRATTRALVLSPSVLVQRRRLPIRAHRLDWPRRLHRAMTGRSTWLALEQTIQAEVERNHLTYRILTNGGYWLHISTHAEMREVAAGNIVPRVERGDLPSPQRTDLNYRTGYWAEG